jgi:hypothetical protein
MSKLQFSSHTRGKLLPESQDVSKDSVCCALAMGDNTDILVRLRGSPPKSKSCRTRRLKGPAWGHQNNTNRLSFLTLPLESIEELAVGGIKPKWTELTGGINNKKVPRDPVGDMLPLGGIETLDSCLFSQPPSPALNLGDNLLSPLDYVVPAHRLLF